MIPFVSTTKGLDILLNSFLYIVTNLLVGSSPDQQLQDVQTIEPGRQVNRCYTVLKGTQRHTAGEVGLVGQAG